MWALGPDRKRRPAAECGWFDPMTETRADGPEESPHHTWTPRDRHKCADRRTEVKKPADAGQRTLSGLTSICERVRGLICCPNPHPTSVLFTEAVQNLQQRKFKSLLCPLCYHFKVSFYSNNAQELNLKLQRFPGVTKSWMASKQEQFIQTRCLVSTLGQIRAGTFSWPINMPADRKLFWSFSKLECQIFSCSSQSLSSSFCVFKCSWLNLCISHMFTLSPVGHLK